MRINAGKKQPSSISDIWALDTTTGDYYFKARLSLDFGVFEKVVYFESDEEMEAFCKKHFNTVSNIYLS